MLLQFTQDRRRLPDKHAAVPEVLAAGHVPVGGGQVGCDYQVGSWVIGGQGMFNWSDLSGDNLTDDSTRAFLQKYIDAFAAWVERQAD